MAMITKSTPETDIPLVAHAPGVRVAHERLEQLCERLATVERQLSHGSVVPDGDEYVSRLLADPTSVLAPAKDREQLDTERRALRTAVAAAEREVEAARAQASAEFARTIAPARRKSARAMLEAAEYLARLVAEEIASVRRQSAAGHTPSHVVYATDLEAVQRVVDRVRRGVESMEAAGR